uniref:Uncharacterized protein n=1 Tax=Solanum tuberosum TaxID=4113 RepID=M1D7S7_SOLTU
MQGISLVLPEKISSLLEVWQSQEAKESLKPTWRSIPNCIMWILWLERNKHALIGRSYRFLREKNKCIKNLYLL